MPQQFDFASSLKGLKILLVEHDPQIANLLFLIFEATEAEVFQLCSADNVVNFLLEQPVNILIYDIQLPAFREREVIQQVRATPENNISQIPAIAIATTKNFYTETVIKKIAIKSGFSRFLTLPEVPDEIVETVLELAERVGALNQ
ncbi:response regulator [Leptolyngbya sp. FACHB-16]|uniref:response regulator n=1 Tax=unclassified Leptolyngbya TaxID=2650499 RepID=UPI001687ADB2|nr:response regulator [Leptolyngbya sp. FACHB-16]MBD2152944.1 hypothetical protein [Leptolyngbya sp. FACHB-16]